MIPAETHTRIRQQYEELNQGRAFMSLIWLLCLFVAPLSSTFRNECPGLIYVAWASLACGIITIAARINLTVHRDPQTTWMRELNYGTHVDTGGIQDTLLYWPFSFLSFLVSLLITKHDVSFKAAYRRYKSDEIIGNPDSYGIHWDTVHEGINRSIPQLATQADRASDSLEEIGTTAKLAARNAAVATTVVAAVAVTPADEAPAKSKPAAVQFVTSGFTSGVYTEDAVDAFDWRFLRLQQTIAAARVNALFQVELVDSNLEHANWLRRVHIAYCTNGWEIRLGRLATSSTLVIPPPNKLDTVNYFRGPYAQYAYGVQIAGKTSTGLSVVADVTGATGIPFRDPGQFDRLEASARLSQKINDHLEIGNVVRLGQGFIMSGVDASLAPHEKVKAQVALRAVSGSPGQPQNHELTYGGFAALQYRPKPIFELHGRLDYQAIRGLGGKDGDLIATEGIRLFPTKQWSLTLDAEQQFSVTQPNPRLLARVQAEF